MIYENHVGNVYEKYEGTPQEIVELMKLRDEKQKVNFTKPVVKVGSFNPLGAMAKEIEKVNKEIISNAFQPYK